MILNFETDAVEIEETDLGVLVVGFYTEENYLMIQQNLDDEQDIRLGINTYHIERDDQSYGGYGGVEKIILHRNLLEITLDETGIRNLQCNAVEVEFQTEDENYELLTEKLKGIFRNLLIVK